MIYKYFTVSFEGLCRKGRHDDNIAGKFSNKLFHISCISVYRLLYPATPHSQAYMTIRLLAAKFIFRVILLFVFLLEV